MKDKLKKIPIGKLFMEIFSVVLAVLVALAVNEWRTNRSNQQTAANALENIIQEITSNQEEIKTSLDEHLQKQETLRSKLKEYRSADEKQQSKLSDSFRYGYAHSVLNNTAWNSANLTQAIKFLKFDIVAGHSIEFDGEGHASSDWRSQANPTIGAQNTSAPSQGTGSGY